MAEHTSHIDVDMMDNPSRVEDEDALIKSLELTQDHLIPDPGLSRLEKRNLVLLFLLYFFHAIPLTFSWNTMPVLLREQLTYTDIGTFLVSQYPYSVKAIWTPVVEAFYVPMLGMRKTWIVPCFILLGLVMLWLGSAQDLLVTRIAHGESLAMVELVVAWLLVMIFGSNLRIAIDAWALELISQPNIHWTSSIMTISEVSATFVSFNLFLGLSSFHQQNTRDGKAAVAGTRFFYTFWAVALIVTAFGVLINKTQQKTGTTKHTLRGSYSIIWKILARPQVWTLVLVHMTSMIGFETNDAITILQLVKNGFSDRDIASLATISFPFTIFCGIMINRTFETSHPLRVWRKLFPYRLLIAFLSQCSTLLIAEYHESHYRFLIAVVPYCLSKFMETAMFIALIAFHAQVSDPQYGGIYLPLLATSLNLRYDTMGFIFTKSIGMIDGGEDLTAPTKLIDGYQIVGMSAIVVAIPVFWFFLRPATKYLQTIDPSAWHVGDVTGGKSYEMVSITDDALIEEE